VPAQRGKIAAGAFFAVVFAVAPAGRQLGIV
jgi:hypothetical protein